MKAHDRKVMHSSEKTDWGTPQPLFNTLARAWGPFDVDICATKANAKCLKYITPEQDALSLRWWKMGPAEREPRIWMNPPYGRGITGLWVKKAFEESQRGCIVVCLLPARTDTQWFHVYCKPHAQIEFLAGRVKFEGAEHGAPFPSMVVVFGGK